MIHFVLKTPIDFLFEKEKTSFTETLPWQFFNNFYRDAMICFSKTKTKFEEKE